MHKRPILIITICYIIGIIWGIYFKRYIPFLFVILLLIAILSGIFFKKSISKKKYLKFIIIILFVVLTSTIYVSNKDKSFYNFKVKDNEIKAIVVITDVKNESEYYNNYIAKVITYNTDKTMKKGDIKQNINMYIRVKKNKKGKNVQYKYGDMLEITGEFEKGEVQRNYKGFSQFDYYKQKNIYGSIKCESAIFIKEKCTNKYNLWINKVKTDIKKNLKKLTNKNTTGIACALMLGDSSFIEEEQRNIFSNANLSHVLAISGMHVSYFIMGIGVIFKKISTRTSKYIFIFLLIIFASITGASSSVLRAVIMSILTIISKLIYKKDNTLNNISFSALIILMYNPYYLFNLGFQLSFLGTLGIVLFNAKIAGYVTKLVDFISTKLLKIKRVKSKNYVRIIIVYEKIFKGKLLKKIVELISVSISANILIFPILIYNFNKISFIFLFSNLLVTPILAILVFSGYLTSITSIINIKLAYIPAFVFNFMIFVFEKIAKFSSSLDFFRFTIGTPKVYSIIIMYILIFTFFNRYTIAKYVFKKHNKKIAVCTIIIILVTFIAKIISYNNTNFTIYFVDVGQGDCTVISTTAHKNIIIDGGGSENGSYDVGSKILVPYLLDRQIKNVDYIIFSHFDSDHCLGLFTVIQELNVKNVVICEQSKISTNYKFFCNLVKEKNVNVIKVKKGDALIVDKYTSIKFLWPDDNQLSQNPLNNNSVVCKVYYKNTSILFTGDIEKLAENEIIQVYGNKLQSNILKVAHHGSKTSSTEEFINAVNSRVVLIGVGKNNKFGHPNEDVIKRLEDNGNNIFRTDLYGEIIVSIDRNQKIKIKKFINNNDLYNR